MKKGLLINISLLMLGVILLLATESENATTNFIGLMLVVYECDRLNLFNYGSKSGGRQNQSA